MEYTRTGKYTREIDLDTHSLSQNIKQIARETGFSACGITNGTGLEGAYRSFEKWAEQGKYAGMDYLLRNRNLRKNPLEILPGGKSIIVVLLNYYPEIKQNPGLPEIAKYAYGSDYHRIMKKKLRSLLHRIQESGVEVHGRPFVDSAPLLERSLAMNAGLGYIGKNSCLISPEYGSYVFIGELIVDIDLAVDSPFSENLCKNCSLCVDACPAGALDGKFLDARKCISYHSNESKEAPPKYVQDKMDNKIFGCDMCQDVCPRNASPVPVDKEQLNIDSSRLNLKREVWLNMGQSGFDALFKGTVLYRTGYEKIRDQVRRLAKKGENQ